MSTRTIQRLLEGPPVWILFWGILLAEKALCLAILYGVSYTEIDWQAYMQQTTQFMGGERDYSAISGGTGPLVYPAGFVYIFSLLNWVTGGGKSIVLAQWIYADFAVLTMYIVLTLYTTSKKIPWYALPLLLLSKRIHSIFILRLFNDPVAMIPLYLSIYTLSKQQFTVSAALFSLALSVKMNILLFAPAYALLMFQSVGIVGSLKNAFVAISLQLIVALPFIAAGHGASYFANAFEFGRQFLFVWTVNWRFVGEAVFSSTVFSKLLVAMHLIVLFVFIVKWTRCFGGLGNVIRQGFKSNAVQKLDLDYILLTMFTCNLVGITFARSLHYQFYAWYFHSLPYLLFRCKSLMLPVKIAMFFAIEYCWNVYPSTNVSSILLFACHLILLSALLLQPTAGTKQSAAYKPTKAE
ncbi:dolichyl-P-Man:Man(5)GlcNAc(2)-PP-dolichol alpha-1,3-mannosyltransferase [Chytriomyces hyalinus]|nr:dolichyl-P-Man:Man(5)GlcNAc(2)-PP-dolichol alpha-1,3-mannosyltransferase [Chytriomyces hyalinus]